MEELHSVSETRQPGNPCMAGANILIPLVTTYSFLGYFVHFVVTGLGEGERRLGLNAVITAV